MSLKIPAPAPVCFKADCPAGTPFHGEHDDYFKVGCTIPRWGMVKSMRITILRKGKQTHDIWMQDFGVTLRDDQIWLSMQFYDPCGKPAINNDYHVEADIDFLGQTIDIDWPPVSEKA